MEEKTVPLVSVIMAVYNGEEYLREAIESILNQTFKEFELIIIDDGSSDSSVNIIKSYRDDRIKLIQQENKGPANARNNGISKAKGKYIAILDDDDIALPTRLEKQVEFMEENQKYVAVGSWVNWISAGGENLCLIKMSSDPNELKKDLLFKIPVPHGGSLFRKSTLLKIGGYKNLGPHFYDEDGLLMVDLAKEGKFSNIQMSLSKLRVRPSSNTQRAHRYKTLHQEIVKEYFDTGKINHQKAVDIDKSWREISQRMKMSYYYNKIGIALHSSNTNKMLAIKYLFISLLFDPLNLSSYKSLLAAFLPHNLYLRIRKPNI